MVKGGPQRAVCRPALHGPTRRYTALLGLQDQGGRSAGGVGPGDRSHGIGQDESGPGHQDQR